MSTNISEQPSAPEVTVLQAEAEDFARIFNAARAEIGQMIVGQDGVVEASLTAIFCGGNVLLEGVPAWVRRNSSKPSHACWNSTSGGFSSRPT